MNCPQCQQVLSEGARFCASCGLSVASFNTPTERVDSAAVAAAVAQSLAGRVLDGKYELGARLGTGGMGAVYRARRVHIGDEVAVKVLHPQFVADAQSVERFRREARAAAVLRHPNVVTIHDFGEAQGSDAPAYIVMELVEGMSLRELLQREGRLQPARAVALMEDVCAGVGAAHRRGIVHRDLKPDNIIVLPPDTEGARETAKVVDFGIAKLRDAAEGAALTAAGTLIGTPYYMSPEQCRGEPLDARADVYSLGALLYEMLTGAPPFTAETVTGVVTKHLTEPPPPLPPQLAVPRALDAACMRALAKNPNERQADAHALRRELQTALAHDANVVAAQTPNADVVAAPSANIISAQPTPPTQQRGAPPAEKRGGAKWVVAGLLVLLLVGGIAFAAFEFMRPAASDQTASTTNVQSANAANVSPAVSPPPASVVNNNGQDAGEEQAGTATDNTSAAPASARDLTGTWTGTYGPMSTPATLVVKEQKGDMFSGVLAQGTVRVAFNGTLNAASGQLTIKETRVLSGDGWSLGEGTGTLATDGRSMSGTGQDPMGAQLGLSYQWSFTRQTREGESRRATAN